MDVARGLDKMHSRHIIHLDLKSPNVLLTAGGTAKIAVCRSSPAAAIFDAPDTAELQALCATSPLLQAAPMYHGDCCSAVRWQKLGEVIACM